MAGAYDAAINERSGNSGTGRECAVDRACGSCGSNFGSGFDDSGCSGGGNRADCASACRADAGCDSSTAAADCAV